MTYTQLKIEHCQPLDVLLSGRGYFPELDCSMRQWFTDGPHKGLSTPEERAACHTLGGGCSAGVELCTPDSRKKPRAERILSLKQEDEAPADACCSISLAAPECAPSAPTSSGEEPVQSYRFKCRRGYSLQKDADGTPLFVPDSPSSSGTESESTDTEEVAAYCQVRNIWTILGGNLNKPGAKQATKILRRVPCEVYGGAVLTALKRSADMSVEEAIQYKRARILDIMSPKAVTQRCEQRRPSSCPAAVMPPSCMETPDGKGIAQQAGDTDSPGSQSCVGECNSMRATLVTISA
ncbi:g11688 [Coccomyxa viridis]|uniref:G11688 protein n=1 Tax=Coccomyxa viridis TaxID=1274662 RepID=A0ABP1GD76_9CHLO